MTLADDLAALRGAGFECDDKGHEREYFVIVIFVIKCKRCGARWSLATRPKREGFHGGNLLALLDHAASHAENWGEST